MYILRLLLLFFLAFISLLFTDSLSVIVIFLLLFFLGRQTVVFFQKDTSTQDAIFIFETTYMLSFVYALSCFWFMTSNGYDHLQSFDGINVYIPYTQELLSVNSFSDLLSDIYTTSKYAFVGSILIPFVYIGKLSAMMDGELYVVIQLTIMLFASWTAVVIYNILQINNIQNKQAVIYTLVYALLSIHFYMSTFIVRDMPIALFFTLLIYLSFKSFTLKQFLLMIILVISIGSIRISSGIFASLYIFLILYISYKQGNSLKKVVTLIALVAVTIIALIYIDSIISIFKLKMSQYQNIQLAKGDSAIAAFNILPPGIKHIIKALYIQFMPIPSWRTLVESSFRPESYNIMNFPVISATFFRYMMWFVIFIGILHRKTRSILLNNKILIYNFIIAILYISLLSNNMAHRRLLAVYPIFFLTAILIYERFDTKTKQILFFTVSIIFIFLQTIGLSSILQINLR